MIETAWFFIRCFAFATVCAVLLLIASCSANAQALDSLVTLCLQGNAGACSLYQSMAQQQAMQQQLYQNGIDNLTNYLTTQQLLANQRMQRTPNRPSICTQQGVFVVCQ